MKTDTEVPNCSGSSVEFNFCLDAFKAKRIYIHVKVRCEGLFHKCIKKLENIGVKITDQCNYVVRRHSPSICTIITAIILYYINYIASKKTIYYISCVKIIIIF